jgi:CRISPR-associated protein Cmr3
VVDVQGYDDELAEETGYSPLGGERRLMHWGASADKRPFPPTTPPEAILESIAETGVCRLILLTPAYFKHGWRPEDKPWAAHGVETELVAAVVGKAEVISGWDLAAAGPKPTRRLAPAGSVYFLRLKGTAAAIRQWVSSTWLSCLSDDSEGGLERASGFGLAVVGTANPLPEFTKEDH